MPDTLADEQFERFCHLRYTRGIRWRRIPPARKQGHKRPDYALWVGETGGVAEVKQLDPNKDDVRQQTELEKEGYTSWNEEPGRRVRRKITEAADQLRSFARRGIAGILVLFDGTRSLHYLDPHNVMTGMYGLDALEIERVHGPAGRWHASRWKSGGKEKITPTTNTSVSALAVLHIGPDRDPYLVLYHNEYAAVRLDAPCVARLTDHQFIREIRRPAGINVWIHAITGEILQ